MTGAPRGLTPADIEDAERRAAGDRTAPWYVDVFLAIGGWLAGLFAAGAIFSFAAAILPHESKTATYAAVSLVVGAAAAIAGTLIGRRGRRDFIWHFAIAAIAAGLTAATAGFWYLVSDALGKSGLGQMSRETARIGYAGLIAAAAAGAASIAIARAIRDAILSFLTTLAVFAVIAFSISVLNAEHAIWPWLYWLVAPASALIGIIVFTRPFGREVFVAVGGALMIGPMLYFDGLRNYAEFFGLAPPSELAGYAGEAIYVGGVIYGLAALRDRYPRLGLVAAAIVLFAGIMLLPSAGDVAILILLAGFVANHRGLAAVGAIALAWFITRFYYDLSLSLLEKSAIMAGLGAATLAGMAILGRLLSPAGASPAVRPSAPRRKESRPVLLTLGFAAVIAGAFVMINQSVWRLESEFRDARSIFLPLGPSDPRSLIQGDYMTLIFRQSIYPPFADVDALPKKGQIFLSLDADNVASFSRVASPGDEPGPDEIRVNYARDAYGTIQYCTTSFFFQEGDSDAYARARFAVVLVAPSGKTRLVDLADENRALIDPDTEDPARASPR